MRYNLYDDFFRLTREFERRLNGIGGSSGHYPEVNIYDNKEEYLVIAKVPGVDKKEIGISIKDNSLKISADVKQDNKEKNHYLNERFSGKFERNFMFDEPIQTDAVKADLKDGILFIHLPKTEEAKPKLIEIA